MSLPTGVKSLQYFSGQTGSINVSYTDTVNNVTYYAGRFKTITLSDDTNIDASNIFGINNTTNQVFRLGITSYNGVMDPYSGDYVDNIYVDTINNILYVIGPFRCVNDSTTTAQSPGYPISFFATWNITTGLWIKPGLGTNFDDVISTSIFDADKKLIYLGGSFRTRRGGINPYFTIYDMNTQAQMANMNIYVDTRVLTLYNDKPRNNLYVGGSFTKVGYSSTNNITAYRIAILSTNTFTWSVLGSSTSNGVDNTVTNYNPNNEVRSLSYSNYLLTVGGFFSKVYDSYGNINVSNRAIWDIINNKWITTVTIPCFKENTQILTNNGYKLIQNLRKGDLIKTLKHNFKPIDMIGKREIYHPALQERIIEQLYKCSPSEYTEIFEDLIITGRHAILADSFINEQQIENVIKVYGEVYGTDDKYRIPVCTDPRASIYETSGMYTIYHLALENDNYYTNYGIYANGLLVETCSIRYLKELSNMTLIQ